MHMLRLDIYSRNQIREFVTSSQENLTSPILIAKEITKEFRQRFISDPTCYFEDYDFNLVSPIISNEDNIFLTREVGREEIKNAPFDLAPDKSSGPDEFPPFFPEVLDFSWKFSC